MEQPTAASWPTSFPKTKRLRILADTRFEYNTLNWTREDSEYGSEWTAFTPYSEVLSVTRDETMIFQALYMVGGNMEEGILHEVEIGMFNTFIRARQAIADYVVDHWGSYRAWEEYAEMEMAQEPQE